jgi:erythromycin esterase
MYRLAPEDPAVEPKLSDKFLGCKFLLYGRPVNCRSNKKQIMHPLSRTEDLRPMLDEIADRKVVMLGEASHGTHEYYTWRTAISKKLILEKGFRFIAVEGDWPDCYRINRYVKGYADAGDDITAVLKTFDRWPTWMWANWEIAALAEWLRAHNSNLPIDQKIGFYGLDVYSLWDSMHAMIGYLEKEDQAAASAVRKAIQCFEPFGEDEQLYARAYAARAQVLR